MTKTMAEQVADRKVEVMGDDSEKTYDAIAALDLEFIRDCFAANERGDAILLAALLKNRFLHVPPPADKPTERGLWYKWGGVVWDLDTFRSILNEVEGVALAYELLSDDINNQRMTELEELEVEREEEVEVIKKKYFGDDAKAEKEIDRLRKKPLPVSEWFKSTLSEIAKRAKSLRGVNKMKTIVEAAPIVDSSIAITPNKFDQQEMLFPVGNGIIDLQRGILVDGRPSDLMTRRSTVNFVKDIDYSDWVAILNDICFHPDIPGSDQVAGFIRRYFGYCLTASVKEEAIVIFVGPGRNGKGTILEPVIEIFGQFFHQVARSLFCKQRFDPPPNAASEHLHALMHKRLCIGSETNKEHEVDDGELKKLTGGNKVNFRKNFGSEDIFTPTHKFLIDSNYLLKGMTGPFSLSERLVILDFPWRYVDDVGVSSKREPALAGRFKKKNKDLKGYWKQPENLEKVLKWAVDGALDWDENGLQVPPVCLDYKTRFAKAENHVARFIEEMLIVTPKARKKMPFAILYDKVFTPWWTENMDSKSNKIPIKATLSKAMREGGYGDGKVGGNLYFYDMDIVDEAKLENNEMCNLTSDLRAADITHYNRAMGTANEPS